MGKSNILIAEKAALYFHTMRLTSIIFYYLWETLFLFCSHFIYIIFIFNEVCTN